MNVDDVYGCLYSPKDGTIDPSGWVMSLARGAKMSGAQVFEDCPVVGIDTGMGDEEARGKFPHPLCCCGRVQARRRRI